MNIYTKAGDNGRSSTLNRTSLSKDSPVFELLGSLDELQSSLGLAKQKAQKGIEEIVEQLQKDIMSLSGEVAGAEKFATSKEIEKLEKSIDSIASALPESHEFIVFGNTESACQLNVCRAVARKAERAAVAAKTRGGITKEQIIWLNRLSDLLFVLARLSDNAAPKNSGGVVSGKLEGFCDKAEELCKAVRKYAKAKGVNVVVAVSDAGANAVCLQREDEAYIASIDIAMNKAFTSASLKMSTKEVGEMAKPGAPLYGIQNTNNNKIVIFGGGEPLYKNGVIVGALGVSGGSAEQDTAFAEWGAEYFNKEM